MIASLQRLRVTFARGEEVRYISHLDLMRLWERAARRAGLVLAYTQGFTPHPRISLAAPLAIGVTSEAELMDVFLEHRYSPYFFMKEINKVLPEGIEALAVEEVGLRAPSLQSLVRFAEYLVKVEKDKPAGELLSAIKALLAATSVPRERLRDKEVRRYDLRPLVDTLNLVGEDAEGYLLGMRLRTDSTATGRPDEVVAALGLGQPLSIHRTKLILETAPPRPPFRNPLPPPRSFGLPRRQP